MALDSASALRSDGAMTWTRFLQKSQGGDVRWLNRTLLLPTSDHLGVLPDRLAPRVFEDIHEKGKNPDGAYWQEFNGSGGKFNLFERVCERVPKSRPWLLREFIAYVQPDPAPILDSRARILAYANQRGLHLLPGRVVAAVKHLNPVLYADLERRCTTALIKAATPSTLIFVIAYLHEMVWRRRSDVGAVQALADDAVDAFIASLSRREFDDAGMLAQRLRRPLCDVVSNVVVWGDRAAPSKLAPSLEDLPPLPFLVHKSQDMLDACACLHAAGEQWYERIGHSLPERYQDGAVEVIWEGVSSHTPARASLEAALLAVKSDALRVHGDIGREYEASLLTAPGVPMPRAETRPKPNTARRRPSTPQRRSRSSAGSRPA